MPCSKVYIRSYESGGTLWPFTFNRIMFILFAFLLFMVSILYWKKAWVLSTVLLLTGPPFLYQFWVYVDERFHKPVEHVTLETARQMPTAEIDSIAFTPPAMREDIAGWGPEQVRSGTRDCRARSYARIDSVNQHVNNVLHIR